MKDSFNACETLRVGDCDYEIHRILVLALQHNVGRLPYCLKNFLGNLLRHETV